MSTIHVDNIPESGMQVEYSVAREGWLRTALHKALHDQLLPDDSASVRLRLHRFGTHVDVVGGIYVRRHGTCDRCLREYPIDQQVSMHLMLTAAGLMRDPGDDEGQGAEDGDGGDGECQFGVYHDGQIDLEWILTEQVLLAQPMRSLCGPECPGLCAACGQDLNEGPCQCTPTKGHGPFTDLKKLQIA